MVGFGVGRAVGVGVGAAEASYRMSVGDEVVGACVGTTPGLFVIIIVGPDEGAWVGRYEGADVGMLVGADEGMLLVGDDVGSWDGWAVGRDVGPEVVGVAVGMGVIQIPSHEATHTSSEVVGWNGVGRSVGRKLGVIG